MICYCVPISIPAWTGGASSGFFSEVSVGVAVVGLPAAISGLASDFLDVVAAPDLASVVLEEADASTGLASVVLEEADASDLASVVLSEKATSGLASNVLVEASSFYLSDFPAVVEVAFSSVLAASILSSCCF